MKEEDLEGPLFWRNKLTVFESFLAAPTTRVFRATNSVAHCVGNFKEMSKDDPV